MDSIDSVYLLIYEERKYMDWNDHEPAPYDVISRKMFAFLDQKKAKDYMMKHYILPQVQKDCAEYNKYEPKYYQDIFEDHYKYKFYTEGKTGYYIDEYEKIFANFEIQRLEINDE